jgi:hypothetical protein
MQYTCFNAWLLEMGMSDGLLGVVRRTKLCAPPAPTDLDISYQIVNKELIAYI